MGEVFAGRYELVDVLASGGTGTVWRTWDHREHAYRAAKVLRQSDGDSLLRFVRETSGSVRHPHVLAPYSWTGEDDRVLFTMPLVRGGSVATLLGDLGALPLGWAIELFRQALVALGAVHRVGLVHRDVKPANLLLDATGQGHPHLLLSDFGAAARLGAPRLTSADSVIGTPGYLAPEQLAGADPAPAQDVYAVAVVMSEMLTGTAPSAAGELAAVPRSGATARAVAELVDAMTAPDPAGRPASADDALAALDAVPGSHDLQLGSDPADPVEIFDHVPALPDGWGEKGPTAPDQAPARPVLWWQAVPTMAWLLAAVGLLLLAAAFLVS
jgi:serine/threonine protein kinase